MKKIFTLMMSLMAVSLLSAMTITIEGLDPITTDTEVSALAWDEDFGQYDLDGHLVMPAGVSNLAVEITRSYTSTEEAPMEDEFCMGGSCKNSNGEAKQTLNFTVNGESDFFAHFVCPEGKVNTTILYRFVAGTESILLTVHYGGKAEAISNVAASEARKGVYTIFGQKLRDDNNTEGLPSGMYIIGGKKQIIK